MRDLQRFFIELAYEGTSYHGWQAQNNATTVQQVLNEKLSVILRQPVETLGCGRTDAGVHARQFFAHFDMVDGSWLIGDSSILRSLNSVLPKDIAVKKIFPVAADAHARFDATLRAYEYHIHFEKDPFKNGYAWLLRDRPDVALMNKAAQIMKEYVDFSCFSKSHTQTKTNNCKIFSAEWVKEKDGIIFKISADRFLRNMVRAVVGTLLQVGNGAMHPYGIHAIIGSKNRSNAGTSVPACGLYLTQVRYPYPLNP